MTNYLMFERRGCEFFKGETSDSDIKNYRLTTPGQIVPGKDGNMYCFEFGQYDRYHHRTTNKRTGAKLKKPVDELVMKNAMHIDSQFSNERGSWRNLQLETEFYKTPRKYTAQNILDYVNSVSSVHYDAILYVDTIEFEQPKGANFTPSVKIYEWVKNNKLSSDNTLDGIRVHTYTGTYKYHSYKISPAYNPENERVTIYLERVEG